jgi:ATP adenylyltransferase
MALAGPLSFGKQAMTFDPSTSPIKPEGIFMRHRVDVQNAGTRAGRAYAQALEKIDKAGVCPFCEEHLPKHHRNPILFSNRHWIVSENAWPYEGTRHQFVLIAREHIEGAEALPSEAWEALGSAYRRLVDDYSLKGATLLLRTGLTEFSGASVAHLHAQVISGGPRRPDSELLRALVGFKLQDRDPNQEMGRASRPHDGRTR